MRSNRMLILVLVFSLAWVSWVSIKAGEPKPGQTAAIKERITAPDSLRQDDPGTGPDSLVVIHFHPTVQCSCCINVGNFSRKALEEYYAAPYKDGSIVFRECNIDEDTLTSARYGIFGSALGFSRVSDGKVEFEDIQSVWEFCEDHDKFLPAFRKELDDFLKMPKPDTSETARPGQKSK